MSLTPAEIDNVAFRQPPVAGEGYHHAEVDAFLEDAADEIRRLAAENRALTDRLTPHDLADRLHRAQQEYLDLQETVAILQRELEQTRAAAPPIDSHLVDVAQRTADEHLAQAREQAQALLNQATTRAAQLLSEAQLRASTVVADARHAHGEVIAGLEAKRAAALDEINELRQAVRHRHDSLAGDLIGRLQELTGGAERLSSDR